MSTDTQSEMVSPAGGQETASDGAPGKAPVARFVNGNVHAGVFRDTAIRQGEHRATYSVSLTKRYYHAESRQWQNSKTLFPSDLPAAIRVLERALAYIEQEEDQNQNAF